MFVFFKVLIFICLVNSSFIILRLGRYIHTCLNIMQAYKRLTDELVVSKFKAKT